MSFRNAGVLGGGLLTTGDGREGATAGLATEGGRLGNGVPDKPLLLPSVVVEVEPADPAGIDDSAADCSVAPPQALSDWRWLSAWLRPATPNPWVVVD